mgnify:CR=1 FL=1
MKKSSLTLKLINAPYMIWAVLFILAPLIMVIYYAFTDRSGAFTLDNIKALSSYGAIFGRSAWYAVLATVICLILVYYGKEPCEHSANHNDAHNAPHVDEFSYPHIFVDNDSLKYRPYKFAFKGCGAANGAAYQHSGRGNPRNGI